MESNLDTSDMPKHLGGLHWCEDRRPLDNTLMRSQILFPTVALLACAASPAAAEMQEKTGTFGGLQVTYEVVLPHGYNPATAYPTVLVFTGGSQGLQGARGTPQTDWQQEAERRGYIIISPAAPEGRLFFEGGDRIFPEFLDFILKTYKVRGKLHVAGHSNGGISAFHVATKFPHYFSTLTGYPGLLEESAKASALKSMCIFMHVGEKDDGWRGEMAQQAASMKAKGYTVQFTVEPNQVHRIKAAEVNLSPRLFDEIESCH
jgi:poly(3-hydroxybutyrate) depolymerase